MSKKHPVIAVTGSSGAGTTTVKTAFEHIFYRLGVTARWWIEGDSFHRYDRTEMQARDRQGRGGAPPISAISPSRPTCWTSWRRPSGLRRDRRCPPPPLHPQRRGGAAHWRLSRRATFTPWEEIPQGTDLLFYEGLHGGVKTDKSTWRAIRTC